MWNLLTWMVLGGLVGMFASRAPDAEGNRNLMVHLATGVLGAILGGTTFTIFDTTPLDRLAPWGIAFAVLGALIAVLLVRVVMKHVLRR